MQSHSGPPVLHVLRLFKTTSTKKVYCLEISKIYKMSHSLVSIQEDFKTSIECLQEFWRTQRQVSTTKCRLPQIANTPQSA